MSEPFIGEIRMFAGNYAPKYWGFCEGQYIGTSENPSLFSLLHNIYGGDGVSTFALPDMRGRLPVGDGAGPGLTNRQLGERFGRELEYLSEHNMPPHNHAFRASQDQVDGALPAEKLLGNTAPNELYEDIDLTDTIVPLNEKCIESTGGGQPHPNVMPFLCVNFIIALKGVYPPRS